MRKKYKNINSVNFNTRRYNNIMESILPEVKRIIREESDDDLDEEDIDNIDEDDDLDEKTLNELFGFGSSSVKKPAKALSLENADDENAELVIQWCGYFMAQAGNNV